MGVWCVCVLEREREREREREHILARNIPPKVAKMFSAHENVQVIGMNGSMIPCACVRMHVHTYVCMCIHTHAHVIQDSVVCVARTCPSVHTHVCSQVDRCTFLNRCVYIHACLHACRLQKTEACTHADYKRRKHAV